MRSGFLFLFMFLSFLAPAQELQNRILKAWQVFEKDPQLANALISLHVVDAGSGKTVFSRNGSTGMAPASTQKIITAATAYELLGRDFRYRTGFLLPSGFNPALPVQLFIKGSGDPTLGSWRWKQHSEAEVLKRITAAIQQKGVRQVGEIMVDEKGWESELVPDGWIWQDIGNYYGAGGEVLNWRENQYDLILRSGKQLGDPVTVAGTRPVMHHMEFRSFVTSAAKGSGDQSYIYLPLGSAVASVRGTIPVNEENFVISGSMPSPRSQFIQTLLEELKSKGIQRAQGNDMRTGGQELQLVHTEVSPSLDSINYWFLRKSINLYGEALVKSMASVNGDKALTANGLKRLRDFWASNGIARTELNMYDGSGLSPLNRVTTAAQVKVLLHARSRPWFSAYYDGFPEFNGMKMKSGTISGVKGFAGYHKARSGQEYVFSFIVNNYNGSASQLVQKMYRVLDELK